MADAERPKLQPPPPPHSEQPSSPSASPRSSSPSGSIGSTGSIGSSSESSRGQTPPLDIISEDHMEMDLRADQVIDPEVALKACQEVLLQVKLQNREWVISPDTSSIKEEDERNRERDALLLLPLLHALEPDSFARGFANPSSSKHSWLLRLFDPSCLSLQADLLLLIQRAGGAGVMREPSFQLNDSEGGLYLPQLLNMSVPGHGGGDAIQPLP
ncbi:hypothetical protein KUCAC02_037806, partial [Chaenocephalus aceratus]